MLKPENIPVLTGIASSDRDRIEKHFDAALGYSKDSGRWPARPRETRSGWNDDDVEAVKKKYADAGWILGAGGVGDMCTIDHPDRKIG